MGFWLEFVGEMVAWVLGEAATEAVVNKISRRVLLIVFILFILIMTLILFYYFKK